MAQHRAVPVVKEDALCGSQDEEGTPVHLNPRRLNKGKGRCYIEVFKGFCYSFYGFILCGSVRKGIYVDIE